ncbi:hypothetical protein SAMN02744775_03293 [Enterobacter sp. CC120223-11]|nr:hypothetical protein SAMN02744775_03293 [Enterobacter sp. CC120223-11]
MIPFSLFNASGLLRLGVALLLMALLWLAIGWAVALP